MATPLFLTADDIRNAVSLSELLEPLTRAMIAVSDKRASLPPRFAAPVNGPGRMGIMYGSLDDPPLHGAKVLSLYPGAPEHGMSSHQGFVQVFDSRDGRPLAILDADIVTAMRTAAVSVIATRALTRTAPKTATICGAGEQAEWHVRAFLESYPEIRIRIWARDAEKGNVFVRRFSGQGEPVELVPDLSKAVSGADVVTLVTSASTAFLPGALLAPGQHVNLVGASLANVREIDDAGVARLTLFTDALSSSETESGEVIEAKQNGAIDDTYPIVEIGEVLAGRHDGRSSSEQITGYKSHGLIVQDLAAAAAIVETIVRSREE